MSQGASLRSATLSELLAQGGRLGLRLVAGSADGAPLRGVDTCELDALADLPEGTLAVVPGAAPPSPYLLDVALRRASARGLAGLVLVSDAQLTETARALAERGRVPVLVAPGAKPSELAVAVDRLLSGGASETMTRVAYALARATEVAADPALGTPGGPADDGGVAAIVAATAEALGVPLRVVDDPEVTWHDTDAVCVGEVPVGRLVADDADPAAAVAVPVVAALLSRVSQRQVRERYASTQSRADLIVELVLAEASRVEGFTGPAARLGLPLHLSHAAGWLRATTPSDPDARPPRGVAPALELFGLQLVEGRPELWHLAFLQDDVLLVSTEDHGAGDHQRRLREVGLQLQQRATELAGPGWAWTLGLGTPQTGAAGLRQTAAEARLAAESAVASGRPGGVEVTDVTGLRRVLLDVYASPTSRSLLADVLLPLDALGPERADIAVRTLASYLARRGSLTAAGKDLVLHPNAVTYRVKRIREVLQLDLDDPDTRFAVELACRVRLLGAG